MLLGYKGKFSIVIKLANLFISSVDAVYSKYPYLLPDFINLEISLSLGKGLFIRLSSKLGYLVISFVVSNF